MSITITEALAEIKTIGKRIEKKRAHIIAHLARQEGAKDPLEKEGGSALVVERERQAITDLDTRTIALRRGIQRANDQTEVTISGRAQSISEWLIWKREVMPRRRDFLTQMSQGLKQLRDNSRKSGFNVVSKTTEPSGPTDIVINIDEGELAGEIESLEAILGELDGQLSLKNATIGIVEA